MLVALALNVAIAQEPEAVDTVATGIENTSGKAVGMTTEAEQQESHNEAEAQGKEGDFNAKDIIFEHLGDGYGWEMPFNHHKRIALPVIVWASDGLHLFSSSRLEHGAVYKDGDIEFMIAKDGDYKGKVVEMKPDGSVSKPWDISITKNVLAIIFTVIIVLLCVMPLGSWYKANGYKSARGFKGALEALYEFIYVSLIKATLKEQARRFAPYLLTVFMFIFVANLMGLVVVFPGGANLTGNIAITLVLALMTFFITNIFGTKHYWKEILWPDVPLWLKFPIPIMPIIEIFGMFTKPAALTVRLFANMMGGHIIVISLTLIIFIFAKMGVAALSGATVVSMVFQIFMLLIDVLVSFIQAYVFTMLSTIFISLAQEKEHEAHEKKMEETQATATASATVSK
ncbi:MAG: F0F1 ATP synthase subunit A [Clostridiales bacterium]|nr:F0F1 ATP synthase subunit A [Clostridiales bacterium]